MKTRCFRPALAVSVVVLTLALLAGPAFADGAYHSQHIALTPVGDFPLRSGFVENIHANGPVVFAHENYQLNGAVPDTTFDVYLLVHIDDLCEVQVAELYTASLETNVAGNGQARAIVTPDAAPHNTTLYMRWELRSGDVVAYTTECSMAVLD